MRKICIQSGHWGMTSGATGAPREQERTIAIGLRLTQLLSAIGVEAYRDDAFDDNDSHVNETDWDLYLALHCDANYTGDEGGGFVDFPDPSIDSASAESKRIKEAIEAVYFKESGIRNVPSRSNPNTKFYYMWSALSAKTPCVILEMGESIDPHDNVILNDTERQAQILLRAIQNAFPDLKPAVQTQPVVSTITIESKLYEHLVDGSTVRKQTGEYLEISDPDHAPFEGIQRVIAGIKSRITDLLKQLDIVTAEMKSRIEQVGRLKDQLTDEGKLRQALTDKLNQTVLSNSGISKVYEDRIKVMQGQIDQMGKDKGQLNATIQTLTTKVNELAKGQVSALSAKDLAMLLLKKLTNR